MTHITLVTTITYPIIPAEYVATCGHHDLDDNPLLLLSSLTSAHESGDRIDFLDAQNECIGNLDEVVNSIRTAIWPVRFKTIKKISLSGPVFAFLKQTQSELNLKNEGDVMSVAVHLAWLTRNATIVRTTRTNGSVETICVRDLLG